MRKRERVTGTESLVRVVGQKYRWFKKAQYTEESEYGTRRGKVGQSPSKHSLHSRFYLLPLKTSLIHAEFPESLRDNQVRQIMRGERRTIPVVQLWTHN